jgi:hypothetical protein
MQLIAFDLGLSGDLSPNQINFIGREKSYNECIEHYSHHSFGVFYNFGAFL